MISPHDDDYDAWERMFDLHVDNVYSTIDMRLGLTGDALTKELIYRCIFEGWREEQKEALDLIKGFSKGEIYLLNGDPDPLSDEWHNSFY